MKQLENLEIYPRLTPSLQFQSQYGNTYNNFNKTAFNQNSKFKLSQFKQQNYQFSSNGSKIQESTGTSTSSAIIENASKTKKVKSEKIQKSSPITKQVEKEEVDYKFVDVERLQQENFEIQVGENHVKGYYMPEKFRNQKYEHKNIDKLKPMNDACPLSMKVDSEKFKNMVIDSEGNLVGKLSEDYLKNTQKDLNCAAGNRPLQKIQNQPSYDKIILEPKFNEKGELINKAELEKMHKYQTEMQHLRENANSDAVWKESQFLKQANAKNTQDFIQRMKQQTGQDDIKSDVQNKQGIEEPIYDDPPQNNHFENDPGDLPYEKLTLSEINQRLKAFEEKPPEINFNPDDIDKEIDKWGDDEYDIQNDWEIAQQFLSKTDYENALVHVKKDLQYQTKIFGKDMYTVGLDLLQILEIYAVMEQTETNKAEQLAYYEQFKDNVSKNLDCFNQMRLDAMYFRMGQIEQNVKKDRTKALEYYELGITTRAKGLKLQNEDFGNQLIHNATQVYHFYKNIGQIYIEQKKFNKAQDALLTCIKHYQDQNREEYNVLIGRAFFDLAESYNQQGDLIPAIEAYHDSITLFKDLYKTNPMHQDLTKSRIHLAEILDEFHEYEQAIIHLQDIINECPKDKSFAKEPVAGRVLTHIGILQGKRRNYKEAIDVLQRVLEIDSNTAGAESPQAAVTHMNIAVNQSKLGDVQLALANFESALMILRKGPEENAKAIAEACLHLGDLMKSQKEGDKARAYYKECLEIKEKLLGEDHIDVAQIHNNVGISYRDCDKNYEKSTESLEKAFNILDGLFPEEFNPLRNQVQHSYLHSKMLLQKKRDREAGYDENEEKMDYISNMDMNADNLELGERLQKGV